MWAFLFLAGLFSGWWGALSFAAPPAPNLTPSTASTSKNSPMTLRDSHIQVSRTLPYASNFAGRYSGDELKNRHIDVADEPVAVIQNHLEPYRYSSRHNLEGASRSRSTLTSSGRSSRRKAARPAESVHTEPFRSHYKSHRTAKGDANDLKYLSSMFQHDSLPRLRYGKDIVDENASNSLERSPETSGNDLDDRIIPRASGIDLQESSSRPNDVMTPTGGSRDPPEVYQDANLELDNFMNYQVTPTSLRTAGIDHELGWQRADPRNVDNAKREESQDQKRVANNYRIMLGNVRDYRRRYQITTDPLHPNEDGPGMKPDIEDHSESAALVLHPSVDESNLAPNPYHTTKQSDLLDEWDAVSSSESTMERPRVTRAASSQNIQKSRNRTKANSPREQRRQGRNKERRGQNWCPDADIGNRAYLAPTVFEGKARSMSSVRKPGSNYAVTFEVKQVYKSQPGFQPLLKNDSVRLHFRDKVPGKSTLCGSSDASGQDSQSGMVRANIKRGKVYLVFVNRVGPRNFTILGEPMIRSKKNAQAVQAVIRPDYVREVTLSALQDAVARLREKVKLVCRTRGSPPPRVHWLKDGVPLHPRRGLRIQHKRRRSKVVIASATAEDSGRYECVAESTSGHRAALAAKLLVTHAPETTTAAWPRQEAPCPISKDFCMNGGTCLFFETVGEPACRCAEGFTGIRCENKDVTSTGSGYSRHRGPFSCKLGLSTSYYC